MSKFCYEEGEIRFADCQCEFCVYYNNGERSSECPKDLLDKIESNGFRLWGSVINRFLILRG